MTPLEISDHGQSLATSQCNFEQNPVDFVEEVSQTEATDMVSIRSNQKIISAFEQRQLTLQNLVTQSLPK